MDETTDLSASAAPLPDALPPLVTAPPTSKNYRTLSRNGKSKKVAQALRRASQAGLTDTNMPGTNATMQTRGYFVPPHDGLYSAEQVCKMLGISRQSLCYHTGKPNVYRRLYYVRKPDDGKPKRGAKMFYVTAVELYRFCLVNSYAFPPGIQDAIDNYSRSYGPDDWDSFRRQFQSNTSGVYQAVREGDAASATFTPPQQKRTLPTPLVKGPFDAASPKISLTASPTESSLSSGNPDPLTEMLK